MPGMKLYTCMKLYTRKIREWEDEIYRWHSVVNSDKSHGSDNAKHHTSFLCCSSNFQHEKRVYSSHLTPQWSDMKSKARLQKQLLKECPPPIMPNCSVVSDSLRPQERQPARLLYPWDFPGKNIGVGCHFLVPEIFQTQGSNLHLLHCK